jgi:hypothetical protein
MKIKEIKTLLVYHMYREGIDTFYESYIKRLNEFGFDVESFCLTIDPPSPRLAFAQLDILWKKQDRKLRQLYKKLQTKAKDKDVLVLFNGSNLHPDFLEHLNTFNAYMCFDDPESSSDLSKPVSKFFDACFVGNIASLEQYHAWRCNNVFFRPLGYFTSHVCVNGLTEDIIARRNNDVDVCLFCERQSMWRKDRLDFLEKKIPNLYARGKNWDGGWATHAEMLDVYSRSKIGLNLHNSVGPVNMRTYVLPANGIMQICDNKYFLGHIYELGREVVGYCDVEEVPELVNYYLRNEQERKRIAIAGWKRAVATYNEVAVWEKQMKQIAGLL